MGFDKPQPDPPVPQSEPQSATSERRSGERRTSGPELKTPSTEQRVADRRQSERRNLPRILERQPVTIRYSQGGHVEFTAFTRDVNAEGVFLLVDSQIAEGSEVELLLTLPIEESRVAMQVRGRVVRSEATPHGSGIAVAFQKAELVADPWLQRQKRPEDYNPNWRFKWTVIMVLLFALSLLLMFAFRAVSPR